MRPILLILLVFISSVQGYGQLGKLLKEKAKNLASEENLNKLRGAANNKLEDARAEIDSSSFNFAISVNDNSDFFNADSGKDKAVKFFTNFQSRQDATEAEKARSMLDAGELAYAKGYYQKAEILLTSAKIKYEANSISDLNYYASISNLGLLYGTMGRYTKAEEFTMLALNERKTNLGEQSLGYGASLNNLSVLQKETGRYNEAEVTAQQAISVLSLATGNRSMSVAIALNNEAMLKQAVGRYQEAEISLNNAIDISDALQSERSNNHLKFLSNRALLYQEMGKYEEAEKSYNDLIKLKERRLGTNHPDYAHMLNNLASLYMLMGKYDKVESLLVQARDIYQKKFGTEHRLYASAISDLGNFYRFSGRFEESKKLLTDALAVNERVLGASHPDFVQSKEDLAIVNWKMGNVSEAKPLYQASLEQSLLFINSYFPPMSEAEKTKYWDKLRPRFERFYSFAFNVEPTDDELVTEAFNYHIATKGLLLNSTNKIKQQILASGDQKLVDEYLIWLDQKEALSKYYGYSKEELIEQKINRDSLENAANQTERNLSKSSAVFTENYQLKQVTFEDVTKQLDSDHAAVEMIRYRYFDKSLTNRVYYAALVATSTTSSPLLKILENGEQLEGRYFKYYNNAIQKKIADEYSYDQYWATIIPLIDGKKEIFLSSDGIYNQINVNTLLNNGRYVIEDYNIHIVGNSKYIGNEKAANVTKSAFLIGNPIFGGSEIAALPGTKSELAAVSKLMTAYGYKMKQFTTAEASEKNIKSIDNPAVLHIATHGYFLQDLENNDEKVFGVSAESARSNPLLRSGLLLSGAGNLAQDAALDNNNNGVLTAYEAINLKLDNTNLVVLSACETGVGDVKAGEGVYGLQRAFIGAGAQSLLMSLWKVNDEATQELMTKFYAGWLKTKDKQKSFKEAQLSLKAKYKLPYYWGAFVLLEN